MTCSLLGATGGLGFACSESDDLRRRFRARLPATLLRLPAAMLVIVGLLLCPACQHEGKVNRVKVAKPDLDQRRGEPSPQEALQSHFGKLIGGEPVTIVPGFAFHKADSFWLADGGGNLLLLILRNLEAPLDLTLELASGGQADKIDLSWDRSRLRPMRETGGGSLLVSIADVTKGLHALTLATKPGRRLAGPLAVADLSCRVKGRLLSLRSHSAAAKFLRDFLLLGVAGIGPQKHSGILIAGNREMALPAMPGTVFSVTLENVSKNPAEVSIAAGESQLLAPLEPYGRCEVTLPIRDGRHPIRLDRQGDDRGFLFLGAPKLREGKRDPRPPIILITLDTTRFDAIQLDDRKPPHTPHLRRLARHATFYESAFATAPWTLPSHASIFTGFYPGQHRAGVTLDRLPRQAVTLAELLRRHAYDTLGLAGGPLCRHRYGLAQGFDSYRNPDGREVPANEMTNRAIASVKSRRQRPFFLFLNYFDAHAPYTPPLALLRRFGLREPDPAAYPGWSVSKDPWGVFRRLDSGEEVPDRVRSYLRSAYMAEVAGIDYELGRFFSVLRSLGIFDRAFIAIVADHGELLGEHDLFGHSCRLDPELVRIPMIVKWPGQHKRVVVKTPVSQVDLFSTILSVAGIKPPPNQGSRLTALPSKARPLFFEEHESSIHPLKGHALFLATDLYGAVTKGGLMTSYAGKTSCLDREEGRFVPGACPPDTNSLLSRARRTLTPRISETDGKADVASALSTQDRRALEALGYF